MEEVEEIMEDECSIDVESKAMKIYTALSSNYLFASTAVGAELTPECDVVTVGYTSQDSSTISVYPHITSVRINSTDEAKEIADIVITYMSAHYRNLHVGMKYSDRYKGYVIYGIDRELESRHPELLEEVKRCWEE